MGCGTCWFCQRGLTSLGDVSNPNAERAAKATGHSPSAAFGDSHLPGGIAGGQAQLVRVPFADFGAFRVVMQP